MSTMELFKEVKAKIVHILQNIKKPHITVDMLLREYAIQMGCVLPFTELGRSHPVMLLLEMQDVLEMKKINGVVHVRLIPEGHTPMKWYVGLDRTKTEVQPYYGNVDVNRYYDLVKKK